MPPYPILCYEPGCGVPAAYKIAARWSDGLTSELKTYGLACEQHLPAWFRWSLERQASCRRAKDEILERPGIYLLGRGRRDVQLIRLAELEEQLVPEPQELSD
jgi:hypothetical protein